MFTESPEAAQKVIDTPVAGPVSFGAGGGTAYLIYQLASGEVYATMDKTGGGFAKRQSLVSGQGGLPAAAGASGPAIAFDPARGRVAAAYLTADKTQVVVVSTDAGLGTGWTQDAVIPLQGNALAPGMAMISGTFGGTALTVLYAVTSSSKVIWASSFGNWSGGFQSVTNGGEPLNPPAVVGVSANLNPASNQIALGFCVGNQHEAFLLTNQQGSIADFPSGEMIPGHAELTPAVTIEPDSGAWNVFVNMSRTVYLVTHYDGSWQSPQEIPGMQLAMSGPPAAVWRTHWELYVACVTGRGNLTYQVIALGAEGERPSGAKDAASTPNPPTG
jgi:hypothetical protein